MRFIRADKFLAEKSSFAWVLPPFVAKGSSMMLYGRQGLGKTSLALQLVHALGTGGQWMGFPTMVKGPSLYLNLDMSEMEMRRAIERTREAGIDVGPHMVLIGPDEEEEALEFDILNEAHAAQLRHACQDLKPVCVIVDAIADSFEPPQGPHDVNALGRSVLKAFRRAIGGEAILVYLNHKKKGIANFRGQEVDDEDDYMGATIWASKPSASIQLKSGRDHVKSLVVRKTRIDAPGVREVILEDRGHGFYRPRANVELMLLQWPSSLECYMPDPTSRADFVARCKDKSSIFKAVAEITGVSFDTVRQKYYRNVERGVAYEWDV